MNWWHKLSDIGNTGQKNIQSIRQIHILNRTIILTCLFISIYIPLNLVLKNYFFAGVESVFLLLTFFSYYFQFKTWFRFSTYYIFFLIIINITFSIVVQNNINLEVLMISGSLGGFVMFKNKRDSLTVLFLFILAFAFSQFLKNYISPWIVFKEPHRLLFSYFNICVSFIVVGAVIINFKSVLESYEATLLDQKHKIDLQIKEITDSITYAERIQQAILPEKNEIYAALPNCFVLFKPKDIVSGDFYSFSKTNAGLYLAAADCTGHGVPGALMSMLSSEKLNDACAIHVDVSEILKQVNKGIKTSLRQSDSVESTRDGMDIALCKVDQENKTITYAGANRPLWIIRKGSVEVEEIKATKTAIGGLTEENQVFKSHSFQLNSGDTIYISTDGYADQFNGKSGKKLMTKRFKELLLSIQHLKMSEQEKQLNDFIDNWKAGTEQMDDILVIGVKLG